MEQQSQRLRSGVEIVIACPGRLLDHLWKGTFDLQYLEILVIDEADRMVDMGFVSDIRNILMRLMNPRQTLLFSAISPAGTRRLVQELLHDTVTAQIGRTVSATYTNSRSGANPRPGPGFNRGANAKYHIHRRDVTTA